VAINWEERVMEQAIPAPHRPLIMGTQQAVSTGHYLATLAAMRILDHGGNAVDAGVAAGLCLGVLYPDMVSIAGVAPIIFYHSGRQEVTTISGLGRWPRRARAEYFQEHCGGKIPRGILRTVVPAAPDAWITALEMYGTMRFGDVAESAIALCEDGYPAHRLMCEIISEHAEEYAEWQSSAAVFLARGRPPRQGEIFFQKDLGRTLRLMGAAEHAMRFAGRAAALNAAREAFYRGEIADTLVRYHESHGGLLTAQDLAEFRVKIEPPVSTRFHGYEVYACGPWCQGPVLPQVLNLLEGVDLTSRPHNSPEYIHLLVEALKLVYADRERYYGDPEFVDIPLDGLLSKAYAKERAQKIDPEKAHPEMPPFGNPWTYSHQPRVRQASSKSSRTAIDDGPESLDTSYLCVVDRYGNIFSATPSDGSSSSPVIPGLGFVASSRGSQSWADPGHASSVQPWKRPRLTPNPALVLKDGKPFMAFGTPGGDVQCQAMLQAFLNIVCFGLDPQQAVEAPRFASASFPNSFEPHAYQPGRLNVEASIPEAARADLERKGHKLHLWPEREWRAGAVSAIVIDADEGVLQAAADPRRMNYALAW
jgi:gamma-glutamyltranspeptidase / glutathione hydrolase